MELCDECEVAFDDIALLYCHCGQRFCEDCWYEPHENDCTLALEEGPVH